MKKMSYTGLKQRSIRLKMSVILIFQTTLILTVFAVFNYIAAKSEMNEELKRFADIATERLAGNLVTSLWDVDVNRAEETIKSEMTDRRIYAVVVKKDDGKTVFAGKKRDGKWNTAEWDTQADTDIEKYKISIQKKRDILKDGEKMGTVELCLTEKFMTEAISKSLVNIATATVLINIALLITLFFSIRRYLIRPVSRVVYGLNQAAHQVSLTACQVSSASQSLSESASEQAASVEESSASLEEMNAMGRETSELTRGAEALMNENIEKSARSLKSLIELTNQMSQIEADSGQMSQIIKTIDEIAFQTNLLALNAAIEAARAGESGAGFAVVADEVRSLALRSTAAAKNTQQLIDSTIRRVSHAARSIKDVNSDFEGIIESATVMGEKTASITQSSREQSKGIEQISLSSSEIDKITQNVAASAQESAAVSEELAAQAEQMKSFAEELASMIGKKKYIQTANESSRSPENLCSPHLSVGTREKEKKPSDIRKKEVKPEELIPMDDDDFTEF
jgi:methyl-accepting chemotaxis protein